MKHAGVWVVAIAAMLLGSSSARAVTIRGTSTGGSRTHADGGLVVDVWTDRGDGAVYHIGDPIRVFFRASRDCYALIYNLDTEGQVHLLYPGHGYEPHWIQGGHTYSIPGSGANYDLEVSGPAGVEYLQALASIEPFQQLPDWMDPDYQGAEYGPDDPDWRDDGHVVGDPYVGMERINKSILPYDCDEQDCYSAAYQSFYVEHQVPYPRYICADCHGPMADAYYDPYTSSCSVFEIRVDYDWRWRRHYPFYGNPYWYYFRRADVAPRFYGYKQRWSSNDGWVRFRDTFGDRVLWKKNPGYDPKAGDGNRNGPGNPAGGSAGDHGTWRRHDDGRDVARPHPSRPPAQPVPPEGTPVRFRSHSRDVAPPPHRGRGPRRPEVTPPAEPSKPAQEEAKPAPRKEDQPRGDGGGGRKSEGREQDHLRSGPGGHHKDF